MAMTKERLEELKRRLDDRSLPPLSGDNVAELIAEVERLQAFEADMERALDEVMFLAGSEEHPLLNKLLRGHGRSQRSS